MSMESEFIRMNVRVADITTLDVEAVVNAANESLLGGGGVDGAIHAAAGPHLLEECRGLCGCPAGEARITAGYNLRARHIIHTVGPVWQGGSVNEDALLASCYACSMETATERRLDSIAFPAISTGVYRFPPERAAIIAVATVREHLRRQALPEQVIFCCFSEASAAYHQNAIAAIREQA